MTTPHLLSLGLLHFLTQPRPTPELSAVGPPSVGLGMQFIHFNNGVYVKQREEWAQSILKIMGHATVALAEDSKRLPEMKETYT